MKNIEFEFGVIEKVKPSRWTVFWLSLIIIFVMVILQKFNFGGFKLTTPLSSDHQVLQNILPKLESVSNNFKLKYTHSFVEQSYASIPFEQANAYVAIDLDTGQVLAEKNLSEKMPIASLTKIMTAIVALDLAKPDELLTVSQVAENQIPTKIGVVRNQKMSVEELLNALLLTSANDAAEVLKEGIDNKYQSKIFIRAMNEKARFLGLKNSSFSNPQGFDNSRNFSSVEDLAIATQYALSKYPLFYEIVKKDYEFLAKDKNHKQFDLYNWNGLLGVYPGTYGVKIGNTDDAGMTTVVASQRENKKVLAVVLGAPGILERDLWASQILDLGFKKTANLQPVEITEAQLQEKYSTWKYWN